jgi:hypothetical protein
MTKTYCDRCGTECPNYHATLHVNETQTTSAGESVEENYMQRYKDLCRKCKDSLQEWFGGDLGLLGEEALAQLKQQRMAEYAEVRESRPVAWEVPLPVVVAAHP